MDKSKLQYTTCAILSGSEMCNTVSINDDSID